MPQQPNPILQSSLPGGAIGDYSNQTPAPQSGGFFVFAVENAIPWLPGVHYPANQIVVNADQAYISNDDHTSAGTFSDDAAHWTALGTGGGGGGAPLTGVGSPYGVVTPTGPGIQYLDTGYGGTYLSYGTTDHDWLQVGGLWNTDESPEAHVGVSMGAVPPGDSPANPGEWWLLAQPDGDILLTDVHAQNGGTVNAAGWFTNGIGDGDQSFNLQLGSDGQYQWNFNNDGTMSNAPGAMTDVPAFSVNPDGTTSIQNPLNTDGGFAIVDDYVNEGPGSAGVYPMPLGSSPGYGQLTVYDPNVLPSGFLANGASHSLVAYTFAESEGSDALQAALILFDWGGWDGEGRLSLIADGDGAYGRVRLVADSAITSPSTTLAIDVHLSGEAPFFSVAYDGSVAMSSLPAADPHAAGQLYTLAGALMVSAG